MYKFKTSVIALALFVFGFAGNIRADIVECSTTSDVLKAADSKSLVLFNVTDTLYVSSTTLGTAHWREFLFSKVKEWVKDPAEAECVIANLKRSIMLKVPKVLVEQTTPSTIEQLQLRKVPVLGYTQKNRSLPWIHNFDQVVKDNLLLLGINFDLTSKYYKVPASEDLHQPYFKYGIIFNEGKSREDGIRAFLHNSPIKIEKLVLIDNNKGNLVAFEEAAKTEKINFFGFRYNKNDENKASIEPILGIIQLEQFLNSGTIMNDREASQQRKDNPQRDYENLFKALIEKYRTTLNSSCKAL